MAKNNHDAEKALLNQMQDILNLYGTAVSPEIAREQVTDAASNYLEIMKQAQEKVKQLNAQAEQLTERLGMNKEQFEEYAHNPKNFTPAQWEMLERVRRECESFKESTIQRLTAAADKAEFEREKSSAPATENTHKEKKKGVKKSKWIPS